MAAIIVSFDTTLDFTGTPKIFTFEDTSDYAGQGVPLANVVGDFTITSPSGLVVYNNVSVLDASADIDPDGSSGLFNQTVIQVPIDTAGSPEEGIWTILYTVDNSGEKNYVTNTFNYQYVQPEICITQTVDCISPIFTSVDATDYEVENVTPSLSRVHSIYYPNGSAGQGSPVTGTTATISTSVFYNGTETTTIATTATYIFPDYTLIDSFSGSQEVVVDCTYICSIYCCLRALESRMMDLKGINDIEYQRVRVVFNQCMALVGLAKIAIECNKPNDVSGYMTSIRSLSNCTEDCSCSGDDPSRVTGLAGLVSIAVVESGDAYIVVTPVVVGNTTTYTVTVSPTFIALINAMTNTVLVAGANVTITDATIGITTTYTINGKEAIVAAGYGVAVGSSTASFDTTYTVAAALVSTRAEGSVNYTVTTAANQVVPTCAATAPTTGTYLVIMEADISTLKYNASIQYHIFNSTTATALNANRNYIVVNMSVTATFSYKMYSTCVASLTAADVVTLRIATSAFAGSTISGRSITLLRIS